MCLTVAEENKPYVFEWKRFLRDNWWLKKSKLWNSGEWGAKWNQSGHFGDFSSCKKTFRVFLCCWMLCSFQIKSDFIKKHLTRTKTTCAKKILQLSRRFEFFKNTRSNQTDAFRTKHLAHLGWSAYRVNSLQKILNAENFSQNTFYREIRIIFLIFQNVWCKKMTVAQTNWPNSHFILVRGENIWKPLIKKEENDHTRTRYTHLCQVKLFDNFSQIHSPGQEPSVVESDKGVAVREQYAYCSVGKRHTKEQDI